MGFLMVYALFIPLVVTELIGEVVNDVPALYRELEELCAGDPECIQRIAHEHQLGEDGES